MGLLWAVRDEDDDSVLVVAYVAEQRVSIIESIPDSLLVKESDEEWLLYICDYADQYHHNNHLACENA